MKKLGSLFFSGWPWQGPTQLEHGKLIVDLLKHQSTLAAGAVVAVATFYEKFSNHRFTALIAAALIFFVASIICANLAQVCTIDLLEPRPNDKLNKQYRLIGIMAGITLTASGVAFIFALSSLCLYAVINLLGQ